MSMTQMEDVLRTGLSTSEYNAIFAVKMEQKRNPKYKLDKQDTEPRQINI